MESRLIDAAIALGLGLMVGLEREHHERQENDRQPVLLGVRTFALVSLVGWLSATAGRLTASAWLPAAAVLGVAGLCTATFFIHRDAAHGLTSEMAALAMLGVGMLVTHDRVLATAVAVAVTLLLFSKPWFAALVPRLRRVDFTASLQIALLLAIALPLLPVEATDPWGVLSPRRIALFVTLIMGVDFVGYVLTRTIGQRRGAGLMGVVGGVGSSTALTAAMANQARDAPSSIPSAQMATFLANGIMAVRIAVIAGVLSRSLAIAVAPALAAAMVVFLAGAVWKWRAARSAPRVDAELEIRNPLSLIAALKWGALFSVVLVVAAVLQDLLGARGILIAALASGLADVDAITLAVGRQWLQGELARDLAVLAIVLGAGANSVVKAGIAVVGGGWAFGRDVAIVFGAALAASLAVAIVM